MRSESGNVLWNVAVLCEIEEKLEAGAVPVVDPVISCTAP